MRARRESVEHTRLRITEAAMRLHERVGPAATTVSEVAEEAGVTRLTVYRHFPDDESLVMSCSNRWRSLHPRPDPAGWAIIDDPQERVRTALLQTYAWWRTAAPMMTKIYRDLDSLPGFVGEFLAEDERGRVAVLAAGWGARGRARTRLEAALAHALSLTTWQSLCVNGGLRDEEAIKIMSASVLACLRT
jgi:AcrR family transcriptional regulator